MENNNGKIYVIDMISGKQWQSNPESIAFQNDLYNIEKKHFKDDSLERAFSDEYESVVSPIIGEMATNKKLPTGDKFYKLINFIALMHCRVPSMIEHSVKPIKHAIKQTLKNTFVHKSYLEVVLNDLKLMGYDINNSEDYDKLKEFAFSDRYTIEINQNYKMKLLLGKMKLIIPLLHMREWSLVFTDDSYGGFICTDNPVALVSLERLPQIISPGFGMKNTEITMPLTKNMAIVGRFKRYNQIVYASKNTLAAINSRSLMYSERFVFSAYEDFIFITKNGYIGNKDKMQRICDRNDARLNTTM